jgi:hypothetical protein
MSTFRTSFARLKGGKPEDNALRNAMMPLWPNITDALFGSSPTEDSPGSTEPLSISLWAEGEVLKFSIGGWDAPEKAYGVVGQPLNGLDGLEESIANGQYSVRLNKKRK